MLIESFLSNCAWIPQHGAVLCDQKISSPSGYRAALNLFTVRPGGHGYELYVVVNPGDPAYQSHLSISGAVWTYGDSTPDASGVVSRTINDFSRHDYYAWRREIRTKSGDWRVVEQGRSRRLR